MADTSKLTPAQRKASKRASRRALKKRFQNLSPKQKRELRKFEGSTTEFLRQLEGRK